MTTISTLRRRAAALGMQIQKGRASSINSNDLGGYRPIDANANTVVAGPNFGLKLEDLEQEIARWEAA